MSNSTLKTVIVLDPETQEYKPEAHNLTADAAVELVNRLSEDNQKARVVDQKDRHRSSDLPKCKLCKQAAESASEEQPEATAEESDSEAIAT